MTTTTVRDLINDAHRLLNLTASGNVLPESNYQDNLRALNQMVDSWNTERLSIFSTIDQTITWPSSAINGTLGPNGSLGFITYAILQEGGGVILTETPGGFLLMEGGMPERPVLIDDSTYFRDPQTNISYGIKQVNQQQYNGIAVKTVTSTYPQIMWVNMTYPDILITVYPVPLRTLEFHIVSVSPLGDFATLATTLSFPPGYLRAFRYNLACEIAPEFGVEPSPQVQRIAMYSKRNLKRINNPDDLMSLPYSIVGTRQRYNVFAGNY
jgi:hypothetical protein